VFVKIVTLTFVLIGLSRLLPGPNRQVPGYRARPWRATLQYGSGALAVAALVAGCVAVIGRYDRPPAPKPLSLPRSSPTMAFGMFGPGIDTSYTPETQFTSATGAKVSYVLSYSAFPGPFNTGFANLVASHGAVPVIQLLPYGVSMQKIAAGGYDSSLRSYAAEAEAFGKPVILSFAPEANGDWYTWGYGHTAPATWVAAWRHVVTVFRQRGAANVTWMWTQDQLFPHSGPLTDYWPGSAYVGIVGIDGYYARPTDTFASVFGTIIGQARKFTTRPVLISETAVGPESGASKIPGMFAGVKDDHLLGFIWFDEPQHDGLFHQDWRIQDNPAILAAFRTAVKEYR
jgi:mannan endo-1,4-beta-mannosidase